MLFPTRAPPRSQLYPHADSGLRLSVSDTQLHGQVPPADVAEAYPPMDYKHLFPDELGSAHAGHLATAANGVSDDIRTMSPQDIFRNSSNSSLSLSHSGHSSAQVPNAPFLADNMEPADSSPLLDNGDSSDLLAFPDLDMLLMTSSRSLSSAYSHTPAAPDMARVNSNDSAAHSNSSESSNRAKLVALSTTDLRRPSVTSPTGGGVKKPHRRKDSLPPILYDPEDGVAKKRARNTLAARESRQRKVDYVRTLEKSKAELESEVERWKQIARAHGYDGF